MRKFQNYYFNLILFNSFNYLINSFLIGQNDEKKNKTNKNSRSISSSIASSELNSFNDYYYYSNTLNTNILLSNLNSSQLKEESNEKDLYTSQYFYFDSMLLSNITNSNQLNLFIKTSFCNESLFRCLFLSIILGLMIICTIIGNSFVIAAVILERNLHNVANYLIVSLAVADLTVAVMVMPIGAYQEVSHTWALGKILCDIWTSFDVLCCTASILHLVAIALDRYWAITKFGYGSKRTPKRIFTIIIIIWTISAIMAISPHIFGLSSDETNKERCQLTDNLTFQLVSTLAAFYLPLIAMCIIYWKIFQSAKLRIRKKAFKNQSVAKSLNSQCIDEKKSNSLKLNLSKLLKFKKNSNSLTKTTEYMKQDLVNKLEINKNGQIETSNSLILKEIENSNDSNNVKIELNNHSDLRLLNVGQEKENNLPKSNKYLNMSLEMKKNTKKFRQSLPLTSKKSSCKNDQLNGDIKRRSSQSDNSECSKSKISTNSNSSNNKINRLRAKTIDYSRNEFLSPSTNNSSTNFNNQDQSSISNLDPESSLLMYADISFYDFKTPYASAEYDAISTSIEFMSTNQVENLNSTNEQNKVNQVEKTTLKANSGKNLDDDKLIMNNYDKKSINSTLKMDGISMSKSAYSQNSFTHIQLGGDKLNRPVISSVLKKRAEIDIRRERKAAKTLGVIMSCFIICWLPFFLMQILFSVCKNCYITNFLENSPLVTFLTWSGYLNSLLNPVIYTIFSPDFRVAFSKILFGKYRLK